MRCHHEIDGYSGPMQEDTNRYLRTRHGDGYMGFPSYRLVHSAYVTVLSAGEWNDWDEGLPAPLRGRIVAGETGRELCAEHVAERRVVEMRRILKYCEFEGSHGWVLERWMAPAYFGSPLWWNAEVVPGTSLPKLGPFPYRGEYVSCMGEGILPYPQAPSGPFLDRVIEQWEAMRNEALAYATAAYVRKRTYEAEERDKRISERWNRETREINMMALRSFSSTFLEGGRARQLAVEHAGISSNYGN